MKGLKILKNYTNDFLFNSSVNGFSVLEKLFWIFDLEFGCFAIDWDF